MAMDRDEILTPVVRFTTPDYGWIKLYIEGFELPDAPHIWISECTYKFDKLPAFLDAMHRGKRPHRWVADEEGSYVQLYFLPECDEGISGCVPAQLLMLRDNRSPKRYDTVRHFIDNRATALSFYRAFRTIADDPTRDLRHWELFGRDGDDEECSCSPPLLLTNMRSARLDALLASEAP